MTFDERLSLRDYIQKRQRDRDVLLMGHLVVGYHPEQDSEGFSRMPGEELKKEALDINRQMMRMMREADVDLVELQIPFSEPIADGPVFVAANHGAIANGVTPDDCFGLMEEFSAGISMVAMSYYNGLYRMGHAEFARRLSEAGGSGYIVADLPPEIDGPLREECARYRLAPILLVTPTNTRARMRKVARQSEGFLYCQARRGVTGRETVIDQETIDFIQKCKAVSEGRLPLGLGFGIDTGEKIRALHGMVDIAIVGTALLKAWQDGGERQFRQTLGDLAAARW